MTVLLAYPNISEGRDATAVTQIADGFGSGLLDVHTDPDHHRSAYTLVGRPGELARTVLGGAARAVRLVGLDGHDGVHPRVGALDVAPIIHLAPEDRGAACAEALVLADLIGSRLKVPVFLYGVLAGGRTRAQLRRGGPPALRARMRSGELVSDFGPSEPHPTAGATLVAARPPLVAFNVVLAAPATVDDARAIAARIREGGSEGLPATRAIGVWLAGRGAAQVSTNLEDPALTTPAAVLDAVAHHADVAAAEFVGLVPAAALAGFPSELPLLGGRTIEEALAAAKAVSCEDTFSARAPDGDVSA
jgi:glutamate formiminotransferase